MRAWIDHVFVLLALALAGPALAEQPVRVFAAASLTNARDDIGAEWEKAGHPMPSLAYGPSSVLAKQIEAGAPAHVFASADLAWMDYLDKRSKIQAGSRIGLLGKTLVLIVPKGQRFPLEMQRGFDLAGAYSGKLCTGAPGSVPVGIYAQEALQTWAGGTHSKAA